MTRAQLLRGGWGSNKKVIIRPPWSKSENQFTDLCNRCGACIDACPEKILTTGSGKFPVVDFNKGGCSFCKKCVEVCQYDAFVNLDKDPWGLTAKIKDNCLSKIGVICQSCSEVCERGAINFSLQMGGIPSIGLDVSNCNGCGDCVSICPKSAIQVS
ncbi:Ferredoxin-type protein NapF (periplasmic nitrate reductase) [uncultured Candidatus Thioglobus sp.]|nr:Ferredoxin-type protein NapF (periplasmic nitrate reductase) [uncultured Candidatus Thioglobus sp.]